MQTASLIIDTEEFREIPGSAGYYASATGYVYSSRSDRVLKPGLCRGYQKLLIRGGLKDLPFVKRCIGVHRLVALTWLPNPEAKATVNHKDGNKLNNCLDNLEWATSKEQMRHAYSTGLNVQKKGAAHHLSGSRGAVRSEATRAKMAAAKLGERHPLFKGHYHTPFGIFASSFEVAAAAGIAHQTVRKHCNSKHPNWANWYISNEA